MKRVLLVDDEPIIRRSLERILRRAGMEVIGAADASEALAVSGPLALAIVDVHLPGESGVFVVETLRQRQPGLPVIMMTGEVGEKLPRDVVILDKPFDRDMLIETLRQLLDP